MKGLASDFDGTLFFEESGKPISVNDIEAVKSWQSKGNIFGLCTGRPLSGVENQLQGRIECDFYILSSGAVILDKEYRLLYQKCIDYNDVKELYEVYSKRFDVVVQADHKVYAFKCKTGMPVQQCVLSSIEEVRNSAVHGVSIRTKNEQEAKEVCENIMKLYGDKVDAHQNMQYIDIVDKGCSKGEAICELKKLMNLSLIAGIGDSYNDASMLEETDLSYTFEYAPEEIKNMADEIVSSVAEAIQLNI